MTDHPVFHPAADFEAIRSIPPSSVPALLSCAVDWCEGHLSIAAGNWNELVHTARPLPLGTLGQLGEVQFVESVDDGQQLAIWVTAETTLDGRQARRFAQELREAADAIEHAAAAVPDGDPGQAEG